MFLPISLASLLPGLMLLNRSTTPRDSALDIKKKNPEKARQSESNLIEA